MRFTDKVAIVTGAASGIGLATAKRFAQEGARVVIADLDRDKAEAAANEVKRAGAADAWANACDVSKEDDVKATVAGAMSRFGRLDVVVNNAGFVRDRMFVNATEDEWDAVVRVHLKGHFCVARWAAAHWRDEAKANPYPNLPDPLTSQSEISRNFLQRVLAIVANPEAHADHFLFIWRQGP